MLENVQQSVEWRNLVLLLSGTEVEYKSAV
jgi:hypothetical protein